MAEVLKIVSVQRGHDPRDFVLAAFGGAGPLHAAALAGELGIAEVICPPIPGAFSALGLIGTDLKRDYVQTLYTTAGAADPACVLEAAFVDARAAREPRCSIGPASRPSGGGSSAPSMRAIARQSYELSVPVPPRAVDQAALAEIAEAFHDRHLQTYGHDNRERAGADRQRSPRGDRRDRAADDPGHAGTARNGRGQVQSARSGSAKPARSTPRSMTAGGCRRDWRCRVRW